MKKQKVQILFNNYTAEHNPDRLYCLLNIIGETKEFNYVCSFNKDEIQKIRPCNFLAELLGGRRENAERLEQVFGVPFCQNLMKLVDNEWIPRVKQVADTMNFEQKTQVIQ